MKCRWHKCRNKFKPRHHMQTFCSDDCQQQRAAWKRIRGAALVDPLLNDDPTALERHREKILKEVGRAKKNTE